MNARQGESRLNTKGSKMQIIAYRNCEDIDIQFEDGFIMRHSTYRHFKNGTIRNPFDRTGRGVGYLGEGVYKARKNNKKTRVYETWKRMMERCYDPLYLAKRPTYEGCSVCEEWHNFQTFASWYEQNYYEIENERTELDKDILHKGNKIYSPNTCVFVPQRINGLFDRHQRARGNYVIGVIKSSSNRYIARCHGLNTLLTIIGHFDSEIEAFNAYKAFKEKTIKEVAEQYRDKIPPKLYAALSNYVVEITD